MNGRLTHCILTGIAAGMLTSAVRGGTDPHVRAAAVEMLQGLHVTTIAKTKPAHGSLDVWGRHLRYVRGGNPSTTFSATPRSVLRFTQHANAMAGVTGGFFTYLPDKANMARMVGPCLSSLAGHFQAGDSYDAEACRGRPLVLISRIQMAIIPFEPGMGQSIAALRAILPNARDAFVAGGWLVRGGHACSRDEIRRSSVTTAMDFRHRAAFGWDHDGKVLLAASDVSIDSYSLAERLVALGAEEAVLMDSGFSTALVYKGKVLASGHASPSRPSQPVSHAIVVQ